MSDPVTAGQLVGRLRAIVGHEFVLVDDVSRARYGADALRRTALPDAVVRPRDTLEISAIARLCTETGTPLVPRGGGTGYTGGAVPTCGGIVLSLERLNRILDIDEANLFAIVEPNVITGDLQDAVERIGLFYPPDPSSLRESTIGGNVAENAGGPRAFKYGVTRNYVLGLEVVLPTGEILETGGRVVKNVVGYDLTQLLVGSEGTLAIITKVIVRLIPKPARAATISASFLTVSDAVAAVAGIIRARVTPAAIELVDRDSIDAMEAERGPGSIVPTGTQAWLLIDLDGLAPQVAEESARVERVCLEHGAIDAISAADDTERRDLWNVRRGLSYALKRIGSLKVNNDIVVPKGRIPELFDLVGRLRAQYRLRTACFGHVGDGNIHVNFMVDRADAAAVARARVAEGDLFRGVVALGGAISGEHGIGFSKAPYLDLALSPDTITLMKRLKLTFDPAGILNPGKIFPDEVARSRVPAE